PPVPPVPPEFGGELEFAPAQAKPETISNATQISSVERLTPTTREPVPNRSPKASASCNDGLADADLDEPLVVTVTVAVVRLGPKGSVPGLIAQAANKGAPEHDNVAEPVYPDPPFQTCRVYVAVFPALIVREIPAAGTTATNGGTDAVEKNLIDDFAVPPAACTTKRAAYAVAGVRPPIELDKTPSAATGH